MVTNMVTTTNQMNKHNLDILEEFKMISDQNLKLEQENEN